MPKFISLDPEFSKKHGLFTRLLLYEMEVEQQQQRTHNPKPPKR